MVFETERVYFKCNIPGDYKDTNLIIKVNQLHDQGNQENIARTNKRNNKRTKAHLKSQMKQ